MSITSANRSAARCAWGFVLCLGGLLIFGGVTGCVSARYTQSESERSNDYDTSLSVSAALAADAQHEYFEGVKVDTFKDIVQLSGFVNTIALKNKAGDIAKDVTGGRDIRNNITVKE